MTTENVLAGRVALVTGASGGIGQAIAVQLAGAGAAMALGYATNAKPAEELTAHITAGNGRAVALRADLSTAEGPASLVDEVERHLGPIEILVSNAGRGRRQDLDELSVEEFDQTLATNLRGPFLLCQRVVPTMRHRGFGRVLLISSVAAFTGGIVGPHYAASKAGLHGLVHYLANRLAPSGVTVNALAPALITNTGMLPGG